MDERKPSGDSAAGDRRRMSIRIEAPDQPEVLRLLVESDAYRRRLGPSAGTLSRLRERG
jgi:hypothetical protein